MLPNRIFEQIWLVALIFCVTCSLQADTWYVDNDAPGDPEPNNPLVSDPEEDGSINHPFDAIQEGINTSVNGDTVIILPGIYTGIGNRDIDYVGRAITVQSVEPTDAEVAAATVIDCEQLGRGFYFHDDEGNDSVLEGLTVTHGYKTDHHGGGILCYESSPTIRHCVFRDNQALGGGGVFFWSCNQPQISDCVFENNTAFVAGGGIGNVESESMIQRCYFLQNKSIDSASEIYGGGGVYYENSSNPIILNCIFQGNTSNFHGGGISCYNTKELNILHCTFQDNQAVNEGGALRCNNGGEVLLTNCILWQDSALLGPEISLYDNSKITLQSSDIQSGKANISKSDDCEVKWSDGNIDADPGFVGSDDLHLTSGSPCVDTGTDDIENQYLIVDLEGKKRIQDGNGNFLSQVDMGAYEFPYPGGSPLIFVKSHPKMFAGKEGGINPANQTMAIWNAGAGILNWQINEDCPWLAVNPTSGSVEIGYQEVEVSVDVAGLTEGKYTYELAVSDPAAASSPQSITVILWVMAGNVRMVPNRYATIQEAIYARDRKNIVVIAPGIYTGDGNRDIEYGGRAITVRSVEPTDPLVVSATVIDCEGTEAEPHRGFYVGNGLLEGLTIIHGYQNEEHGGGILCYWSESSPTIRHCVFRDNQALGGGGVFFWICNQPQISDCVFENNTAFSAGGGIGNVESDTTIERCVFEQNKSKYISELYSGGAIYNESCSPNIIQCVFRENTANFHGGAIHNNNSNPRIKSCLFEGNQALNGGYGGGIYGPVKEIENCAFSGNTALFGGAVAEHSQFYGCTFSGNVAQSQGGAIWHPSGVTLMDCIVWGNADGSGTGTDSQIYPSGEAEVFHSCIQDADPDDGLIPFNDGPGSPWGDGTNYNIDDDPRFVRDPYDGGDGWGVGDNDDYGDLHLRSDSPCIDTGNGSVKGNFYGEDIDGQVRFVGTRTDMGADEFTPIVMVTNPQAADVWVGGGQREITWEAEELAGNLNLFFSANNGTNWTLIEPNIPNTHSYYWQAPIIDANDCLIKLEAIEPPEYIFYRNGGPFAIRTSIPGPPVESSWPTLGKNFQRTGLSDFTGPEIGCVKWHFAADGPIHQGVISGAEGRVHIASEAGTLYTLDPNGTLRWTYETGSAITNTPTVGADGTVYFGCENGKVWVIDKDGQVRWTSHAAGAVLTSAAIADDGKVFIGSADGVVYAIDPNGIGLWQRSFDDEGTKAATFTASPTIGIDGSVYVGALFDPNLYALDPETGDFRWRCPLARLADPQQPELGMINGSLFTSPVVAADGTIYVAPMHDTNLLAIDPTDGSILWHSDMADVGAFWASNHADSGLIAHWRFDEPNGLIAGEDVAQRYGTLVGVSNPDAARPSGRLGNAIEFSVGHIEIHDYLETISHQVQGVSAWIKTDTGGPIFSLWDLNTGRTWGFHVGSNLLAAVDENIYGVWAEAPYNLCDGNWHHVAVAVEEGDGPFFSPKYKFYADGTPMTEWQTLGEGHNTKLLREVTDVYIGFEAVHGLFEGMIDDVRLYRGTKYGSYCYSKPAIGPDGTIYVSFDDPYLRAVNPDGSFKWITRLGLIGGFTLAVGQDGLIYATADDGSMYVVNTAGEEVSRFDSSDWQRYPVVHFTFDEDSGLLAQDTLGGKDATLYNFTGDDSQWAAGKENGALQFDGINDYAELRNVDTLAGGKSRQVSAWIKTTSDGAIVSWGRGEGFLDVWTLWIKNGKLNVALISRDPYVEVPGNTIVADGQWHLVRAVYKAKAHKEEVPGFYPPIYEPYDKMELYVDGKPDGFMWVPMQSEYDFGSNKITIGAYWDGSAYIIPLAGLIDELTIGFDLESTLAHPALGAEGTMYVADSDHRVWALTREGCSEEDRRLGRPADFTTDGIVNLFDYAHLGKNWMDCTDPANPLCGEDALYLVGDVNRDGYQDFADLIGFTRQWLQDD